MAERNAVITACSYGLFHAPYFSQEHGTTPDAERSANPGSEFLTALPRSMRSFGQVVAYPPNQAFIGNLDPRTLPAKPWHTVPQGDAESGGSLGRIVGEEVLYALIKYSDAFDLVVISSDFRDEALAIFAGDEALAGADPSRFKEGVAAPALEKLIADGALPLISGGRVLGCVKSAHPTDLNLGAHTILENLACKATGVYALRRLLVDNRIDPKAVDYIIETSEEACGDANQRGGGNFAKAIGELCGLANATGCDLRSFCAGPAHGLVHASAMVSAGTARRVVVVAGGTTAKLAMNAKRHIEKGFPVLEDCMASFAFIVDGEADEGLLIRDKVVGMHKIGSGSSPQAVIQDLVVDPLARAGLRLSDIDAYAPELQNSEITEAGGAGNVTLANLKMIAAMAVMKGEIAKTDMDAFIAAHGLPGWAPTQGHIPSGVPALGWFLKWAREGSFSKGLLMGKGSLFLGRMTGLFDGVSVLLEAWKREASEAGSMGHDALESAKIAIGLTIPGSEGGRAELLRGAAEAVRADGTLEAVLFGDTGSTGDDDPSGTGLEMARSEMEKALAAGTIRAAVTFHHPFPIGVATVGHMKAPGNGRDLFIASTTGASSTDRVEALVLNAISGLAVAKAFGISRPSLGLLNLEGAPRALAILRELCTGGFAIDFGASVRGAGASTGEGESLLRGNDILAGTVDVLVCDSLTGNAIMKLLASFSTAGRIEVAGSGYGPGVGPAAPAIGIISRTTAAPVVANAIALMARMDRGGLGKIYAELRTDAERSGLSRLLSLKMKRSGGGLSGGQGPTAQPAKKPVQHGIEGIDAGELEEAIAALQAEGIYCEAGMGCTGPVVMVSEEDAAPAADYLIKGKFIGDRES